MQQLDYKSDRTTNTLIHQWCADMQVGISNSRCKVKIGVKLAADDLWLISYSISSLEVYIFVDADYNLYNAEKDSASGAIALGNVAGSMWDSPFCPF